MFLSVKPSVVNMNQIKLYKPECVNLLGCKLSQIELEVHEMKHALGQVQLERKHLEQQRRMLETSADMKCIAECVSSKELKVHELQEKYDRLEEDFRSKVLEVCALRCELEKQKTAAEAALQAQRDMQLSLEKEKDSSNKQLDISEQQLQLNMARQRFREAQDELEELKLTSQDQAYQLEEYRSKYLQAQQLVEEMRRKIEAMEIDNVHVGEQINCEIQKAKMQFLEKIKELAPLPSVLKATQIKLQEYQKGKLMAEHKLEESSQQLEEAKQQIIVMEHKLQLLEMQLDGKEMQQLKRQIASLENKCNELTEESNRLNECVCNYEKALEKSEKQVEQKNEEVAQVAAQLETVREESARQVARAKDRAENIRRCLQNQITDLELQLAHSRAQANAAQKDRDEIRQRMQFQINNLSENFDQAQMRIRTLHSQVSFLRRSYSNMFTQDPLIMLT